MRAHRLIRERHAPMSLIPLLLEFPVRRPPAIRLYLYLFSLAFHGFIGWRLVPPLDLFPLLQVALWSLLLLAAWLVPAALIGQRFPHPRWQNLIAWSGFVGMGLVSTLFALTLLRDAVLILLWLLEWATGFDADFATITQSTALTVWAASTLITAAGFWNARRTPAVLDVKVPIADLPEGLQGFTIAQISDIHVGPTIKRDYLQGIVDKVNRIGADMVALTGDLVDGRLKWLRDQVEPLKDLQSRHGTFFVTGNHEYYSGAHDWIGHLQELGLRVLLNEHVVLEHNDDAVIVAGVADYTAHQFDESHRSDPKASVAEAPEHVATRILLAHQPRSIFAALEAGFHLQLSGHTHGGQFLPWNWFVPLQQPFTAGLHWHERQWIYISRGTGYWGPPKRFGAPAEITRLVLVKA